LKVKTKTISCFSIKVAEKETVKEDKKAAEPIHDPEENASL